MANPPIGNNFIEGVLGVVDVTFNNVNLGKTLDEASIEFIEDIKDIFFAQDGTQPNDKIPTGQAYQVTMKMGQPTWARLKEVLRGLTVLGNSAKLGRDIYRSGRDNFSKILILKRVDSDGNPSTDWLYRLVFYKAMPMVNGPLGAFGPDTQREVEVVFYCFYDEVKEAFGYSGHASSLGL
jgi:hypothetical protein